MIATTIPSLPAANELAPNEILLDPGPKWKRIEDYLLEAGIHLPLFHRLAWAEAAPEGKHRLLVVRGEEGRIVGGVSLQIDRSRVLPGHRYLRVARFGEGMPREIWEPIVAALAKLTRDDPKILRMSVRVFSRDHHDELGELLQKYGFHREPHPTSYRHTLSIDLRPEEQEILGSLNKSARKNLRDADKAAVSVREISDNRYAKRLTELEIKAIRRTNGTSPPQDWNALITLSGRHPELSRIVGLFLSTDSVDPEQLVGFAWGCLNGTNGEYRAGGTVQSPGLKISISHRLLRDLILWSKRNGASWFDMGGVTVGEPDWHPLHGVSVFKRHFTHHLEDVGEEWSVEPHPARASFVRWIGSYVRRSTDAMQRVRNGWH
jgi:hypothetical protein